MTYQRILAFMTGSMETSAPFTDQDLQEYIVEAVERVFTTMLAREVALAEMINFSAIDESMEPPPPPLDTTKPLVAAAVGFIGTLNGVLYLYFEDTLARELTSNFLGMTLQEVDAEGHETVNDALGEFANMVVGTFKNKMSDRGFNCRLTIPAILRGQHFALEGTSSIIRRLYRFKTGDYVFAADLLIKPLEG